MLILHFGVLFIGVSPGSLRIISEWESHDMEDWTLEWLEIPDLFEQDIVGFIPWKYGCHTHVLIEFDLERSPTFMDLFRAQFVPNQVNGMKGKDGQEQMCFNLLIHTVINRAESQRKFDNTLSAELVRGY